jgi:hypothetical protein
MNNENNELVNEIPSNNEGGSPSMNSANENLYGRTGTVTITRTAASEAVTTTVGDVLPLTLRARPHVTW